MSKIGRILWMALFCLAPLAAPAEKITTEPDFGLRSNPPTAFAFTQAKIVVRPGEVIEDATLLIRDGVIQAIGQEIEVPGDAQIINSEGFTLYPGFIEPFATLGKHDDAPDTPEPHHWNNMIRPERDAIDVFRADAEDYAPLREQGFTHAALVPDEGIFCGQPRIIGLHEGTLNERALDTPAIQYLDWDRGGYQDYPSSQMGVIALIRQSLLDAQWYGAAWRIYRSNPQQVPPETNHSLEALQPVLSGETPLLVNAFNAHRFWQAQALAEEFGLTLWLLGSGYEYRQLDAYQNSGAPLILPLDFPEAPKLPTYEDALDVSLTAMRHWDWAPANPKILEEAGIEFSLTTARLDSIGDFHANLRKAIDRGLAKESALAALTTRPARLLGIEHETGTLETGKRANILVTDGDVFEKETKRLQLWVDGHQHVLEALPINDPSGKWDLTLMASEGPTTDATLELTGAPPKLSSAVTHGASDITTTFTEIDRHRLSLSLEGEHFGYEGVVQLSGLILEERMQGYGTLPNGQSIRWQATRRVDAAPEDDDANDKDADDDQWTPAGRIVYPPTEYGYESPPERPRHVFVQDATIWTSGPKGVIEEGDLLIRDGEIAEVGVELTPPPGALIIDARGQHVTPGLIDCHSHTAIDTGINEIGQEITAEVRIGDVIYSYDPNLYRQLAGGVTLIHPLHGSANAIGGQCEQIKLRWGAAPNGLIYDKAFPTIKFALGENPKRVWSNHYPRTRMGIEQIIRDRFHAARDYQKALQNSDPDKVPPRRDLELEALVEVLEGERLVHCHSYRQDEILMLMRVAEDFGFQIGTFQHILEGYKVAEIMAEHGAMGSAFSDWWAYKFEVYDAIPYNGTIMHEQGVVVSYNSDSDELARRLNTEAAKAVKYGGVPPEEALQFVTINAAIQMGVDEHTGSLEAGKDGDFVIWSGPPLSTLSRCEQTWIEGVNYFNRERDMRMRAEVAQERHQLIQRILTGGESDGASSKEDLSEEEKAFWFPQWQVQDAHIDKCLQGLEFLNEQEIHIHN